jgi:hypothetical protein
MGSNLSKRKRLFKEQGGRCYYCGRQMLVPDGERRTGVAPDDLCTIEHLTPRRSRVSGERHMIAAACYLCNQNKGSSGAVIALAMRGEPNLRGGKL